MSVVGLAGFEPAISCSQSKRVTKLRYSPISYSVCEVPSRFFLFRAQPFMVADSLKMAISQRLEKPDCELVFPR
jgi:hypothetical protein